MTQRLNANLRYVTVTSSKLSYSRFDSPCSALTTSLLRSLRLAQPKLHRSPLNSACRSRLSVKTVEFQKVLFLPSFCSKCPTFCARRNAHWLRSCCVVGARSSRALFLLCPRIPGADDCTQDYKSPQRTTIRHRELQVTTENYN